MMKNARIAMIAKKRGNCGSGSASSPCKMVFPARNVDALAEKLATAVHPGRWSQLNEAALAHIKTWSPERNIEARIQAVEIAIDRVRGSRLEAP